MRSVREPGARGCWDDGAVTPGPRKNKGKSGAEGVVMLVLAFIIVSAIAVPAMILGPKIMGLLVLLGSIWLLAWSLAKSTR